MVRVHLMSGLIHYTHLCVGGSHLRAKKMPALYVAKQGNSPRHTVSAASPNAISENHGLHQRPGGFNCPDGILISLASANAPFPTAARLDRL